MKEMMVKLSLRVSRGCQVISSKENSISHGLIEPDC